MVFFLFVELQIRLQGKEYSRKRSYTYPLSTYERKNDHFIFYSQKNSQ